MGNILLVVVYLRKQLGYLKKQGGCFCDCKASEGPRQTLGNRTKWEMSAVAIDVSVLCRESCVYLIRLLSWPEAVLVSVVSTWEEGTSTEELSPSGWPVEVCGAFS